MEEPVKVWQFALTQLVTIGAVITTGCFEIHKTKEELTASRHEARLNQASGAIRDITDAVAKVSDQLRAHADMFFLIGSCLDQKPSQQNKCWQRAFAFDPDECSQAWAKLDASLSASLPYLEAEQRSLSDEMLAVRQTYVIAIRSHFPPQSPAEANDVRDKIDMVRAQLAIKRDAFRTSVLKMLASEPSRPAGNG